MNQHINQHYLSAWLIKNLPGALHNASGKNLERGASETLSFIIIERLSMEPCQYSEFEITEIATLSLEMIATRKASPWSSHKNIIAYDVAVTFREKCRMYGMLPAQKEVTSDPNTPSRADKKQKKSMLERMTTGFRAITSMLRIHKR